MFGDGMDAVAWGIGWRFHGGLDGCFPGGAEVGGIGWGEVDEALVELGLRFGEGGEGVDAEEQGAGFGVVDVQDFKFHFHVRVEVAAQVAVDQFKAAIGQFVGQQGAGEADFFIEAPFLATKYTKYTKKGQN